MTRITYTINNQSIDLGTNDSGWGLFIWNEKTAEWRQISAKTIVSPLRMDDKKYVRRAVYNAYRRYSA